MAYDSKAATLEHIKNVSNLLSEIAQDLLERGKVHDNSKFSSHEKPFFDEETPKLEKLKYGSEEYKQSLQRLGPALKHHYAHNSHHPEYYDNGVSGMDLMDLIEMFCDWKAASMRTENGSIQESIRIGVERFNIDPQIASIFYNTAGRMGL